MREIKGRPLSRGRLDRKKEEYSTKYSLEEKGGEERKGRDQLESPVGRGNKSPQGSVEGGSTVNKRSQKLKKRTLIKHASDLKGIIYKEESEKV